MAADVASTAGLDMCVLRDELRRSDQAGSESKTDRHFALTILALTCIKDSFKHAAS